MSNRTPKGFHTTAQGRERSERTLGSRRTNRTNPERVAQSRRHDCRTLSGFSWVRISPTQGALALLATLGWGMKPLRGMLLINTMTLGRMA